MNAFQKESCAIHYVPVINVGITLILNKKDKMREELCFKEIQMLFQTNYKSLEGSNLLNWRIKEDVTVRKRIVSRNIVNAFMLELNAHIFANAKTV